MKKDFVIVMKQSDIDRIKEMTREEIAKFLNMSSQDVRTMGLETARCMLASSAQSEA